MINSYLCQVSNFTHVLIVPSVPLQALEDIAVKSPAKLVVLPENALNLDALTSWVNLAFATTGISTRYVDVAIFGAEPKLLILKSRLRDCYDLLGMLWELPKFPYNK